MIARDGEIEHREKVVIMDYLFKMENFLPAKRGFEKNYHHYLYESLFTFFSPLSSGYKCPQYFDMTKCFHTLCAWYAVIQQINYIN
jgi:hypothetical protein